MRQNRTADHGIAFEEDVTTGRKFLKIAEVESLKIAANIEDGITMVVTESLDLWTGAEVVVDAIAFAWARVAGVVEDEWLEAGEEDRMEFGESFGEGAFASAGRAGKDDEAARRVGGHGRKISASGTR